MTDRIVVGVFESKGEAENASHRLVSEGIPEQDVSVRVLRATGPVPHTMEPELKSIQIDPFFWFLGGLTDHYLDLITNGETAVCVEVRQDDQAEAAASILMMFEPQRVDVVTLPDVAASRLAP